MSCRAPHQTASSDRRVRDLACTVKLTGMTMAAMILLPATSTAQQWFFAPEIEMAVQHVDNPRLQESGEIDAITGGLVNVAAAFHRNTEVSSILFRPAAAIYRYTDDNSEDSEAYFLDFNAEKAGERSNWRFLTNFSREQVFRGETTPSEIDDIGVDDSVQTGTGRTFIRRQRDMWRARPGFTLGITQRTGFRVDVNYLDVQYDQQEVGEAVDYTNVRGDAALVRDLTPDSSVELGVFASRYDPSELSENESVGVRARYEKHVTDISRFFIDVGGQESDFQANDDPQNDNKKSSVIWNIGYIRQLERTRWRFDLGQAVTPSGSGALVERDLYRAIMEHQLRPRWELLLSAVAMTTETLDQENLLINNNRDYLQFQSSLAYQLSRKWTMEGTYGLTYQDFEQFEGDAQEHEVRLSLIYRPPVPTQ